ncbi:MAG: MotA/TolQ/ExbB proton channel family protein [Patescibacteria group bacterium]|nr:MotA/TolQ/ExbB proton channel family protein [Patescibacteria group bacterium]
MRHRFFAGWLGAGVCSWLLLLLVLGVFSAVSLVGHQPALAQDDAEAIDEAPAAAAAPAATEAAPPRQSTLKWMFEALGWMYSVVFLGLSFTLVALFVMNLLMARRENVVPVALVEGFEAHLNEKRYQEAYEMAKNDESFLGQVLSAGLAKLSAGYEQAIEAMQEVSEEENKKMEHRLSYMALIGTISPMVGLLGTVQGMIASFSVIANSPTAPKPAELAVGISTALFTTLVGLFIAIPAIAANNIIRNRVQRLVLEVGILSEGLMGRFASVGKKS